jgi:hypothetical protein
LRNPRYRGRQVWNRQRTDRDLADPADVSLGHKSVQRWNLPDGWGISRKPAHPALVSEADLIAAPDISAARGPTPDNGLAAPPRRRYLLTGLLICGGCQIPRGESRKTAGRPALAAACARVTIRQAQKQADMGNYCVRDLNPETGAISPDRGNHAIRVI